MFSNPRRIAVLCFLFVLSVLAGAMLIPVTAAPQTQQQAYFVPDTQQGDTAIIQVAYEPPPAALQVTDEPAPTVESPTDVSPEPTAIVITAVPTAPPDGNEEPGSTTDSTIKLLVVFLVTNLVTFLATLAGALTIFSRMKSDKNALDTVERIVNALSGIAPGAERLKPTLNKLGQGLSDAGEVLKDVTDDLPNNPGVQPIDPRTYNPRQ